jgi:hypothetical protein
VGEAGTVVLVVLVVEAVPVWSKATHPAIAPAAATAPIVTTCLLRR